MSEEIIIDGVNVAECVFLNKANGFKHCYCTNEKDTLGDERNTRYGGCEYNTECYYKQLKRLQAENERLKNKNYTLQSGWDFQIKMNEKLNKKLDNLLKYRKALEEIRGILDKSCNQCKNEYLSEDYCSGQGDCFEIRQVINEVLK